MQRLALRRHEGERLQRKGQAAARSPLQGGKRLAGEAPHFERALDALRVPGGDAPGALRVDALELRVQRRPPALGRVSVDRLAYLRIRLR